MLSAESKVWSSSAEKQCVYKFGELGRIDEDRAMVSISRKWRKFMAGTQQTSDSQQVSPLGVHLPPTVIAVLGKDRRLWKGSVSAAKVHPYRPVTHKKPWLLFRQIVGVLNRRVCAPPFLFRPLQGNCVSFSARLCFPQGTKSVQHCSLSWLKKAARGKRRCLRVWSRKLARRLKKNPKQPKDQWLPVFISHSDIVFLLVAGNQGQRGVCACVHVRACVCSVSAHIGIYVHIYMILITTVTRAVPHGLTVYQGGDFTPIISSFDPTTARRLCRIDLGPVSQVSKLGLRFTRLLSVKWRGWPGFFFFFPS